MMMKPKSLKPSSAYADHKKVLAMHKDSHVISKLMKPKIRIIHVFAPEIIKTDVANFRELVQSLTGKAAAAGDEESHEEKGVSYNNNNGASRKKMVEKKGEIIPSSLDRTVVKEEGQDYLWRSSSSAGHDHHQRVNSRNFLEGFSDFDGFYDEHLSEFPSFTQLISSRMEAFHELDPKL